MLHLWHAAAAEEATDGEPDRCSVHALASAAVRPTQRGLAETLALQEDRIGEGIGEAIGILGHELRNPLSAITALTRGLLRRADLPGDASERLAQIDHAAQRSLLMIASLLDFSEIRSRGTLPVHPVLSDPVALAATLVEEMRVAHPGREIRLEALGRGEFLLDPLRMGQVLSNLLGNALVHGSPITPVHVLVDVSEREACFAVRNQGPVIPAERVASLFHPFTRGLAGDPSEPTAAQGLGLGLHIVHVIVAAHGGAITVGSDADAHTVFTVRLPAPKALSLPQS